MGTGKWIKLMPLFGFVLLVEVFVCNFRHWESLGNSEKPWKLTAEDMVLESGYTCVGEGIYTVVGDKLGIEIKNIDGTLDTSCIEIEAVSSGQEEKPVIIRQWVMDESHRFYYGLPEREIWKNEKRSTYMTYHLYGKCTGLKMIPEVSVGQTVSVNITLNPIIPLFFSWERVLVLFLLAGLVYMLRPSSALHKIKYIQLNCVQKKILLVLFLGIHMFFFRWLTGLNPYFQTEVYDNQKQYQELAESFKAGSFALLEEPSKALAEMENPYDMDYRNWVMGETGEGYKWDHAYYNGKYYVYFGVVPEILFYFPHYMITGTHLHNSTLIFFLALFFMAGCLGVVSEMIQKWFPGTSLAVWFLLNELLLMGSGIIYMTKRPDLYTVPILTGLAFGMAGIWFFFLAGKGERISLQYVCAGSLFIALVAGSRPQLFLFAAPAAVVLWESLQSKGKLGIRMTRAVSLAAIVPMILVAGGLMYYNYSRFGSVFDFGANYNLTMNDMRNRGFRLDRIPLGIFAYLFQPVKMTQKFPFMEAVYFDSQYMGITIQEATYGGIFAANLFAWFGALPAFLRKYAGKEKRMPWLFSASNLIITIVIIIADTNMSGILQRYFGDFSVFLMLSSVTSVLLVMEGLLAGKAESSFLKKMLLWGLIVCLLWQWGYQGMTFFLDTGESLQELRPDLYAHVKYLVNFWI